MIDELTSMAAGRREMSATHPTRAQRMIRPIVPDVTGERMICATFSGSDMRYRLERLTDADLRPYSRPGWRISYTERPAPSLATTLNMLAVYASGMAEALVLAWRHEIPVSFPYVKEGGGGRLVQGVITWAADEHGSGEVFGMIDHARNAPRTYKLHGVHTLTLKPAPGQTLPVWSSNRWCCVLPTTWGDEAKAKHGAAVMSAPPPTHGQGGRRLG